MEDLATKRGYKQDTLDYKWMRSGYAELFSVCSPIARFI